MIYLDNNATTAVAPEAIEAMAACMRSGPTNPSSKHQAGECSKSAVMAARAQLAGLLGCSPPEIVFTSCATESNHLAILGALALDPAKRHIVTSAVEHPSCMELFAHLAATRGVRVSYVPVDSSGQLDPEKVAAGIEPDTALVSIMWANNETGVVFPLEAVARLARERGALFHTDAVQAVGKLALNLKASQIDLLSLSGHKLHAPTGIGALFVRKGVKLPAQIFGHQERARRGGTENVPGIIGLGAAAGLAQKELEQRAQLAGLRDRLESGVLARIPIASVNGAGAERVANTTNIRFGDLEAELLLERLDRAGICASAGAACTSAGTEPSHVLLAMGLDERGALSSIRFSLGRETTAAEIDTVLDVLPGIVNEAAAIAA